MSPTVGDLISRRTLPSFAPDLDVEPPEWTLAAVCASVDPEIFYPEKGGTTRPAKKICGGCEVRGHCLRMAMEHDERFGVWGGLSERERRRLRRRSAAA